MTDKERIEREAVDHYSVEFNPVCWMVKREGYIAGATAENERAQQELQAYRDKLKGEVESLRQWTEFFNDDEDGEKQQYHVQGALAALKKVSELIDTVTPT